MKKLLLFTGLLTSIFISCSKEEKAVVNDSNGNLVNLEVHAVIGDYAVTKTAVQSNGIDIYWTQGDAINLFYGNRTYAQFTTSINSPSASASFQGSITAVTGSNGNGNGAQSFWGVYPYNSLNTCDGSGVTLTIPSEQSGVAGTFASNLNPTVATSPNLDLVFYNVGSWFIFSVTQSDVKAVTFEGNNGEYIAGKVRVTMDANSRPVATVQEGVTSVTITPQNGGCFTVGQKYYIVLLPGTLSNGYTVTMTNTEDKTAVFTLGDSREFVRSKYLGKLNIDSGLEYKWRGNITFADPEVKRILVQSAMGIDTNHDGEISYEEAAAVTALKTSSYNQGYFCRNTTITSFDELQYFTGLTEIPYNPYGTGYFQGCSSLVSIKFPNTITKLGTYAFRQCPSLASIEIPESVTTIGQACFASCTGLTSVTIPNTVTSMSIGVFESCSNLTSCSYSSGLTTIPESTFKNCTSLESFTIPSSVTSIGKDAFATYSIFETTPLRSITIPASVTYIGKDAFDRYLNDSFKIYFTSNSPCTIESGYSFFNSSVDSKTWVYVPTGYKDAYLTAWGNSISNLATHILEW